MEKGSVANSSSCYYCGRIKDVFQETLPRHTRGEYMMTFDEGTTNGMDSRTTGVLAMGPSNNIQGGTQEKNTRSTVLNPRRAKELVH